MKKVLSLILAVVMLVGCMSITAFAADSDFDITDGVLIDYYGSDSDVVVPDEVTTIGSFAFAYRDDITSISMPETTTIDDLAFDECNGLKSVNMPNVTAIGEGAFQNCRNLESVNMPNVTVLGDCAFNICDALTSVSIPNATFIDRRAFAFCDRLESITVSDALTSVRSDNFPALTTVTCHSSDINAVKAVFEAAGYNDLTYNSSEHGFVGGVCTICGISKPEDDFLTSFTLNKDYNDKYNTGSKNTTVNETLTFTITPVTANAPAFANGGVVTMNVANGVGSVDVTLPSVAAVGEYWYTLKENPGSFAGVTYDANTYYLHLVTNCKDGEYGVVSAQIHLTKPDANGIYVNEESDKIATITNTYGEGKLIVTEEALLNGAPNTEDSFTETVTFTSEKTITGNITYGDNTITPDMWQGGSVSVDITLKGGESVIFENIPDGTTYTVVQKTKADGYDDATYTVDDEDGDEATETGINGTISDNEDNALIHNEKNIPIDVGVILENGAFIIIALGALALGVWLVISKRREREFDIE